MDDLASGWKAPAIGRSVEIATGERLFRSGEPMMARSYVIGSIKELEEHRRKNK